MMNDEELRRLTEEFGNANEERKKEIVEYLVRQLEGYIKDAVNEAMACGSYNIAKQEKPDLFNNWEWLDGYFYETLLQRLGDKRTQERAATITISYIWRWIYQATLNALNKELPTYGFRRKNKIWIPEGETVSIDEMINIGEGDDIPLIEALADPQVDGPAVEYATQQLKEKIKKNIAEIWKDTSQKIKGSIAKVPPKKHFAEIKDYLIDLGLIPESPVRGRTTPTDRKRTQRFYDRVEKIFKKKKRKELGYEW